MPVKRSSATKTKKTTSKKHGVRKSTKSKSGASKSHKAKSGSKKVASRHK
jgi:hypothetical protein